MCLGALASGAAAQDAASPGISWPHPSGYAEVAVANRYVYHGYVAESDGPVVQPYAELFGEFFRGNGFSTSASLKLSVFNSFQVHDRGLSRESQPMRSWYETQIEPGFEFIFARRLSVTASYRRFESPNGAYNSSNAFELTATLDDDALLGRFALHPHGSWITPLDRGARDAEAGNYFQLGIAPRVVVGDGTRYPLSVTFPFDLGLGDRHYYYGKHFGFASAGVKLTVPLSFIPKAYGKWEAGARAEFYYLGKTPADYTNGGDRYTSVFKGLVSTEF